MENGTKLWDHRTSEIFTYRTTFRFPTTTVITSHDYQSINDSIPVCNRFRIIDDQSEFCQTCLDAFKYEILESVSNGKLTDTLLQILKPIKCRVCGARFPDFLLCDKHVIFEHCDNPTDSRKTVPKSCSVSELKKILGEKNQSTCGNKTALAKRLEGILPLEH